MLSGCKANSENGPLTAGQASTASDLTTTRVLRDGFELFVLRNSGLEVAVAPALGAKIVSLKNLRSGREWLWHPAPGLKLFQNQPGDDFSRSPLVGWDECLPTIAPCTWKGRAFPDHGEAWNRAWDLDAAAWERGLLKTSVRLPISSFHFTRTLALNGSRLAVEYVLENPAPVPQEFLWAAHPLLALHEGDQLELTDEIRRQLNGESWLESLQFEAGSPGCAKLYAGPLRQGRAGVFNSRTGDRLTFEWNTAECDTLGLWLTRGGWHGHHHLALEPANGAADSLAVASQSKRCGLIPPRGHRTWRLQLRVEP
jgi:galactose mutarotase-like enzyme